MKKILHCVVKMDMGGIETFLMNVMRKIDRDRYAFDFACADREKGAYDDEIGLLGGKISYLPPMAFKKPLTLPRSIAERKRFFRERRDYDVCHIHATHAFGAYYIAKYAVAAGIGKVIVHSHNTNGVDKRVNDFFLKKLNRLPIIKVACSVAAAEWMFGGVEDVAIIDNGIDFSLFTRDEALRNQIRSKYGWQDRFVVGHVGRFAEQKNHAFLVKVFAEYAKENPSAVLVLIGKGGLEDEIKRLCRERGIADRVFFMGARNDAYLFYQAMDAFVFPSLFEGLPIALIEAQAAGLQTVASDGISKESIITAEYRRLSLNDPAAWVDALRQIRSDADRKTTFLPARDRFDIRGTVAKLCDMYDRNEN